ncbi:MAG: PilZ domain-containing protein, partial [Mesorhizobium sp.]
DEFLLYVPTDGIAYKAAVRWRREDRIGVMFTGTAPKPHWHYG